MADGSKARRVWTNHLVIWRIRRSSCAPFLTTGACQRTPVRVLFGLDPDLTTSAVGPLRDDERAMRGVV